MSGKAKKRREAVKNIEWSVYALAVLTGGCAVSLIGEILWTLVC